jgi:parallel beta-helix repeat protein
LSPYTVTTVADSGPGSLREALSFHSSPITFAIGSGVQVIRPLSPLPTVTAAGTLIDGSTQPGYAGTPLIVLDGSLAGSSANGLVVTGGSCTIQDLVIDNFAGPSRAAIVLQMHGADVVTGNYLGTDATGSQAQGNTDGVLVDVNNLGTNTNDVISGNLISDNGFGVYLSGSQTQVTGNRIGTNAAGTQALPNAYGLYQRTGIVGNDVIGGFSPADRNLISGNNTGLYLDGTGDQVLGNYIGTNAAGTAALGNGVGIYATDGTITVGAAAPGAGNVISGNGEGLYLYGRSALVQGNYIGLNAAGTAAVANGIGLEIPGGATVGGAIRGSGNFISGNSGDGVLIDGPSGRILVQGNFIGTNGTGTAALPNGGNGIKITGGPANSETIGGATAGAGNLISGNLLDGIALANSSYDLIQGNTIGTNMDHSAALPNRNGISVTGMQDTIGGTGALARNLIAGNAGDGIVLGSAAQLNLIQNNLIAANSSNGINIAATATQNVLLGNAIGATAGGLAYPNGLAGVRVDGSLNTLGGTAFGAGNLISGNVGDGVVLAGSANLVQGNTIGANAAHSAAVPNQAGLVVSGTSNTLGGTTAGAGNFIAGNLADGLDLSGGSNRVQGNVVAEDGGTGLTVTSATNTLGGTAAGAGNIVGLNALDGVRLSGSGASGNRVQGNFLGTGPNGTSALGNGGNGVAVVNASNNTIGGTAAGAGNTIAFNGNDGVVVDTGTGNAIRQNRIFSSGNLGIELFNSGNDSQAAPVLTAVTSDGSSTTIAGTLTGTPDTSFTLEFYANDACNPSGYGEGQTFLGATTVITDDSGAATFTVTLDGGVAAGQYVSATATDPAGNTSAFAACWQLPSMALPGLAAWRPAVLAGPLTLTSPPAPASSVERRTDALFRTLGPEARRSSSEEGGSLADAPLRTVAPPTRAGDLPEAVGDLLGALDASNFR